MKIKSTILFSAIFLSVLNCFSENNWKPVFQLEFGGNNIVPTLNERWSIRQDVGSTNYFEEANKVLSYMHVTYFGLKPEMSFFDNKVALSSGLRYYNIHSELYTSKYIDNQSAFFYLRYVSSGTNTEYAKVYKIDEMSHYLGIPLDIKIIPLSSSKIDLYIRTGFDFGYKIASKTNIDFVNSSMESYEKEILSNLGVKTNNFYSSWNNAIGIIYGQRNKLRYGFEIFLPSFFISKTNSSISDTNMYSGFKLLLELPSK